MMSIVRLLVPNRLRSPERLRRIVEEDHITRAQVDRIIRRACDERDAINEMMQERRRGTGDGPE